MTESEILKRIYRCKTDPWYFLSNCVYTLDQVDKVNPIKKFPSDTDMGPYLKLYVRIWEKERFLAVPKSRRMFMSWTNLSLYLWDTLWNIGRLNAFVSKKEDDSNDLIKRAKFIYDHIPKDFIPPEYLPPAEMTFGNLKFPENNSSIMGFAQGSDQLRQYTISGLLADEMAFWPDAQKMYSSAMPTLEGGGRFSAISSAGPGFFKNLVFDSIDGDMSNAEMESVETLKKHPMQGVEIWKNPKNKFCIFQLHYSANPKKRDKDYRSVIKSTMPIQQYLQEYEIRWDSYEGQPVYRDFNKASHVTMEEILPEIGLPLLRGWDFGLCYDDQTEVLTQAGWKFFKDVSLDENVATLNPETFEMTYEKPKLKVELPYKGDMIVWDNQNLQACITPDHIVPVWNEESKEFQRYYAKDLLGQGHNLIRLTANWRGEDRHNPLGLTPKLFAGFMGAYLSEGSADGKRISIYQNDDNKAWIKEIIDATEWDWREFTDGYRLYDLQISEYLESFGVSGQKFVPEEIRQGTKETILEFIRAYSLGDGHERTRSNGTQEHTIYSKSKRMIDEMSDLALKVGWTSSVVQVPPTKSYYKEENRWIVSSGGWCIHFKKTADWSHLRGAKKSFMPYDGTVYCLSVASSILCVRKNGRPHWNGNTPACVVAQLVGSQLRILREFTAVNMGAERFSEEVIRQCRAIYPYWGDQKKDYRDYIDPSGNFRKDTDESTCAKVLVLKGLIPIPGPVTWEARRQSVETFLTKFTKEGPNLLIDGNHCPVLIRGFEGGYRYPEKAFDVEPQKIRPLKDEHSHIHDATQYICSKVLEMKKGYRPGIAAPQYGWSKPITKMEIASG